MRHVVAETIERQHEYQVSELAFRRFVLPGIDSQESSRSALASIADVVTGSPFCVAKTLAGAGIRSIVIALLQCKRLGLHAATFRLVGEDVFAVRMQLMQFVRARNSRTVGQKCIALGIEINAL